MHFDPALSVRDCVVINFSEFRALRAPRKAPAASPRKAPAAPRPRPSDQLPFRVSTTRSGELRWWVAGEMIPRDHTSVRPATAAEARLMAPIRAAYDRAEILPSDAAQAELDELMARFKVNRRS
jgi:hypothetical protein